jgi:hypothetical protein
MGTLCPFDCLSHRNGSSATIHMRDSPMERRVCPRGMNYEQCKLREEQSYPILRLSPPPTLQVKTTGHELCLTDLSKSCCID